LRSFILLERVYAHNGVYNMSADFDELVETSNNIAKGISRRSLTVQCLTRSSVETANLIWQTVCVLL
jgi:dipeptidase D